MPIKVRKVLSFSNASSVMQLLMHCASWYSLSSEESLMLLIGEQRKIGKDKARQGQN
jgi:hypothetical protein